MFKLGSRDLARNYPGVQGERLMSVNRDAPNGTSRFNGCLLEAVGKDDVGTENKGVNTTP